MTTSNQLLPCPFCGGSAAYQRLRDGSKYGAYECGECGAQGPDVRTGYGPEEEWRDKATAAWNERSSAAPPAAAHGDEAVMWVECEPGAAQFNRLPKDWLLLLSTKIHTTNPGDRSPNVVFPLHSAMRDQGDGS